MFILFLMRGVSTSKLNLAFLNCSFLLLIGAKNKSFFPFTLRDLYSITTVHISHMIKKTNGNERLF